jgi:hypothetical protein
MKPALRETSVPRANIQFQKAKMLREIHSRWADDIFNEPKQE